MNRPAYWQLDLFMGVMIGLVVAIMRAHLSSGWATGAEIAWSTLMLGGMSLWVRTNWDALQREERSAKMRHAHFRPATPARTTPLTPVQEHFLAVMEPIETDDSVVVLSEQDND